MDDVADVLDDDSASTSSRVFGSDAVDSSVGLGPEAQAVVNSLPLSHSDKDAARRVFLAPSVDDVNNDGLRALLRSYRQNRGQSKWPIEVRAFEFLCRLLSNGPKLFALARRRVFMATSNGTSRTESMHHHIKTRVSTKSTALTVVQETTQIAREQAANYHQANMNPSVDASISTSSSFMIFCVATLSPRAAALCRDIERAGHMMSVFVDPAQDVPPTVPVGMDQLYDSTTGRALQVKCVATLQKNQVDGLKSLAAGLCKQQSDGDVNYVVMAPRNMQQVISSGAHLQLTRKSMKDWRVVSCTCGRATRLGLPCPCMVRVATHCNVHHQDELRALFDLVVHEHWLVDKDATSESLYHEMLLKLSLAQSSSSSSSSSSASSLSSSAVPSTSAGASSPPDSATLDVAAQTRLKFLVDVVTPVLARASQSDAQTSAVLKSLAPLVDEAVMAELSSSTVDSLVAAIPEQDQSARFKQVLSARRVAASTGRGGGSSTRGGRGGRGGGGARRSGSRH